MNALPIKTMSNEEYHRHDSISKSGLDLIAKSPAHFRYAAHREPTRAMTLGTATHMAILEPDLYAAQYVTLPDGVDRRSSVYKEAVKTRSEESVLVRSEADRIEGMTAAVRGNREAQLILGRAGVSEASLFATDPVTGVAVRCRFDWLTYDLHAVDLKTTAAADDDSFAKSIVNYRYFVQEAFYRDVFQWATGEKLRSFTFLAVESEMPHCVTMPVLADDVVAYGRQLYRRDLNRYADCLASGVWPGLDGAPHVIGMPGWFVAQMDAEMEVSYE